MLDKEIRELPEHTGERWQIEAALFYVLPELAKLMSTKGRALSDKEMLPAVEKSYYRLKKHMMIRAFPEWIGHISDIRGETINAEEWYGKFVHGILWRRLGLIVRDEQGMYRTPHQLIEEYLVSVQGKFDKKFRRDEGVRAVLIAAICMIALAGTYEWVYLPYLAPAGEDAKMPYDKALSENALDAAFSAYVSCADQYECISELINCLKKPSVDEAAYNSILKDGLDSLKNSQSMKTAQAAGYVDYLLASGEVMPWSGQPFQEEAYRSIVALPQERANEYGNYLNTMIQARSDSSAWEYFGEDYLEKLSALIDADAHILGKYYNQAVVPELTAMEQSDSLEDQQNYTRYIKSYAFLTDQNEVTKNSADDIEIYMEQRRAALRELRQNGLIDIFSDLGE